MPGKSIYLEIDLSDASATIEALRNIHTPENFRKIMYRVFRRTATRVKTIVAKDVSRHYEITQTKVRAHIGAPRVEYGAGALGVSCSIPIDGKRLSIGGSYKAKGGRHGWNTGKRYKISARIVKGQSSTLPKTMDNQGGQPPFRNFSAPKLGKVAFTRVSKKRFPIAAVVGVAVPQMPLNRAEDDVQGDIMETLMKRLEHEHQYMMSQIR